MKLTLHRICFHCFTKESVINSIFRDSNATVQVKLALISCDRVSPAILADKIKLYIVEHVSSLQQHLNSISYLKNLELRQFIAPQTKSAVGSCNFLTQGSTATDISSIFSSTIDQYTLEFTPVTEDTQTSKDPLAFATTDNEVSLQTEVSHITQTTLRDSFTTDDMTNKPSSTSEQSNLLISASDSTTEHQFVSMSAEVDLVGSTTESNNIYLTSVDDRASITLTNTYPTDGELGKASTVGDTIELTSPSSASMFTEDQATTSGPGFFQSTEIDDGTITTQDEAFLSSQLTTDGGAAESTSMPTKLQTDKSSLFYPSTTDRLTSGSSGLGAVTSEDSTSLYSTSSDNAIISSTVFQEITTVYSQFGSTTENYRDISDDSSLTTTRMELISTEKGPSSYQSTTGIRIVSSTDFKDITTEDPNIQYPSPTDNSPFTTDLLSSASLEPEIITTEEKIMSSHLSTTDGGILSTDFEDITIEESTVQYGSTSDNNQFSTGLISSDSTKLEMLTTGKELSSVDTSTTDEVTVLSSTEFEEITTEASTNRESSPADSSQFTDDLLPSTLAESEVITTEDKPLTFDSSTPDGAILTSTEIEDIATEDSTVQFATTTGNNQLSTGDTSSYFTKIEMLTTEKELSSVDTSTTDRDIVLSSTEFEDITTEAPTIQDSSSTESSKFTYGLLSSTSAESEIITTGDKAVSFYSSTPDGAILTSTELEEKTTGDPTIQYSSMTYNSQLSTDSSEPKVVTTDENPSSVYPSAPTYEIRSSTEFEDLVTTEDVTIQDVSTTDNDQINTDRLPSGSTKMEMSTTTEPSSVDPSANDKAWSASTEFADGTTEESITDNAQYTTDSVSSGSTELKMITTEQQLSSDYPITAVDDILSSTELEGTTIQFGSSTEDYSITDDHFSSGSTNMEQLTTGREPLSSYASTAVGDIVSSSLFAHVTTEEPTIQ
mgnify:FL=1